MTEKIKNITLELLEKLMLEIDLVEVVENSARE